LVSLLNRVGARPKDVVTIFKMIKRLGALKADLVIM
ncbi:MAG: flagellar basal body P-ring protein FlgI, partial [Elusimicrobia bacterium]|nr:flagellar basal body P-ring protein FlgI [Elusimicrobiota bacterium]